MQCEQYRSYRRAEISIFAFLLGLMMMMMMSYLLRAHCCHLFRAMCTLRSYALGLLLLYCN